MVVEAAFAYDTGSIVEESDDALDGRRVGCEGSKKGECKCEFHCFLKLQFRDPLYFVVLFD